jgi:DNA-binding XRE family transcriptional regulator
MVNKRTTRSNHGAGDDDEFVGAAWARRKVGAMLRKLREDAKLTQEEAGEHIERHVTTMHKIENGLTGVRLKPKTDIQRLGDLYGASQDTIDTMISLAEGTRVKGPFQPYSDVISSEFDLYLNLEGDASEITSYESEQVPGLLQTANYARVLMSIPGKDGRPRSNAEVAKRVELRMERQNVLTRKPDPLKFSVVLSELVLRRPVGSTEVMAEQLNHLIEVSKLPNVSVRVVRFDAGLHLGYITGQFIVLRFPGDGPPIAYSDAFLGGNYFKRPKEIARHDEAFADISKHALSETESRAFINQVVKELSQK